ncbi:prominin-1-A isoform X2 [Hyposmocoma kahamanoa]|uniref:prominin-1-A isoform X2 n=1 Tax=Hyposmocoma kahamanoa TaxID=1477025 RepID=UPI000E6D86B2|nr:prominin-1-A isoform X2 [Hyposmocoma kahamanoa]
MAMIALIFAIFLVNRVKPEQIGITALRAIDVNTLPEVSSEAVFALQIRQIPTTSEATPAASAGNNLNVVATSQRLDVAGNFIPISTIYSFQHKKASNEKYDGKGNVDLLISSDESAKNKQENSFANSYSENVRSLPLVWDNCLETTYKESQRNLFELHNDMETAHHDMPVKDNNNKGNFNIWSKRNTNENNTTAMRAWLDKYNALKNANFGERRQPLPDSALIRKLSTLSPTTPSTTLQIVPITREVFKEDTEDIFVEFVTDKNISVENTAYTEDWFAAKDKTKIKFSGQPQRETYLIPTLKLDKGFHPFGFMSEFFSLIYPFEFPVGLLQDVVWGKFNFPYSFLQSIKIESTFLGFVVVFACMALVIPSYLIVLGILSLLAGSRCNDDTETGALFPEAETSKCSDRVVIVVALFFVLVCCILISGMAVTNEQAHEAANSSRNVVNCACADVAAWLAAAARELHHSLVPPIDMVLQAYKDDLRNVETLLGEPIQQAIASESGIDLVFDSMNDIVSETDDLSSKISSLRDMSIRAGALASATADKIRDLGRQIDNVKKHCTLKDAPLCDTVNTNSLELLLKFDLILHEQQLMELRSLGVENLTRAVSNAKQEFRTLPNAISTQTSQVREETQRQQVHNSVRILTDIVRHLNAGLHSVARKIESGLERVQKYEFWRWTIMLASIVSFGFVMVLILLGMMCGCGNAKGHAKRTLQVSSGWLCFISLALWSLISAAFLITGHAEVYVCHTLWDTQYTTLSNLLDRPSPLLQDKEGIFDVIFRDIENITIDVSVKDILRDCEKDHPAYVVFQLEKVIDVNKETSYFEWQELQTDLGRLASLIDVAFLKTVSAYFNKLLTQMLVVSDVNLAKYRMDYNGPIVGKDLPSLVDQLENIAAQVTDLTTAGRLETLATRLQRLHATNIKPLEQLRADLVFKLTELELQMMPFRRKLNISLSHIHTAQFYIDNQGDVIAHKRVSIYVTRLVSHAAGWRTHVLASTGKHAAKCRPLFDVYSALRALLCTNYVSSLHGWWVLGSILGLLWCTAVAPLCVKLCRIYGRKIRAQEALALANLGSGPQETPTTVLCGSNNNWNTPGPPAPPPRSDSW